VHCEATPLAQHASFHGADGTRPFARARAAKSRLTGCGSLRWQRPEAGPDGAEVGGAARIGEGHRATAEGQHAARHDAGIVGASDLRA
jgi:hypothetical protein